MTNTSKSNCKLCKFSIESIYSQISVQTLMSSHIVTEHPSVRVYKCSMCDYTSLKLGILKQHSQRMHLKKEVGVTENRKKCDECGILTKNIE